MDRRRATGFTPMETRLDVIVRAARLAEDLGYEVFGLAEGWALDSTVVLASVAAQTSRIKLATTVVSIWGRTPATLAMSAATLDQLSGGRYILGLGASTPDLAEGFHDVAFERPARQLADVTRKVQALLSGGRAQLTHPTELRPLKLGFPRLGPVPLWHGTVGPRAVRVTAELADGWQPAFLARDAARAKVAELDPIRRAASPDKAPLVVVTGPAVVVVDDDEASARAAAGAFIAWYLCSMGPLHPRFVASQGYEAPVRAVQAANERITLHSGVIPEVASELFEQFSATGTAADVARQLARWDEMVDIVMVGMPPAGSPWELIEATLRAGAP